MWSSAHATSAKGYASSASTRRGSSSSPRCVPCPHWFQDPPGAAISGNQWRSVEISGHQWPPVAISGNQLAISWQSVAISGNQWQSVAIIDRAWSEALSGNQRPSEAINDTHFPKSITVPPRRCTPCTRRRMRSSARARRQAAPAPTAACARSCSSRARVGHTCMHNQRGH
jgi:hypothetical protein